MEEVRHMVNRHKIHVLTPSHWADAQYRQETVPTFGLSDSKNGIAPSSSL